MSDVASAWDPTRRELAPEENILVYVCVMEAILNFLNVWIEGALFKYSVSMRIPRHVQVA